MILLKWRVFKLVLVLAIAATMPNVMMAQTQMNEIPLGGGSGGGGTQGFAGGATLLEGGGDMTSGVPDPATAGPEAITFDGTYVWVATQFNNSVTRIRVSDGAVAGTFIVGKRPVALLYAAGSIWVANLLSNNVMKITPSTGAIAATIAVADGPGGLAFDGVNLWVANRHSNNVTKLSTSGSSSALSLLESARWVWRSRQTASGWPTTKATQLHA